MALAEDYSETLTPVRHGQPLRCTCPHCRSPILLIETRAGDKPCEPAEVLETLPCQRCEQVFEKGHRRVTLCWRCYGRGFTGGPLPRFGVAVGEDGLGRLFERKRGRRPGEAVYRIHVCGELAPVEPLHPGHVGEQVGQGVPDEQSIRDAHAVLLSAIAR